MTFVVDLCPLTLSWPVLVTAPSWVSTQRTVRVFLEWTAARRVADPPADVQPGKAKPVKLLLVRGLASATAARVGALDRGAGRGRTAAGAGASIRSARASCSPNRGSTGCISGVVISGTNGLSGVAKAAGVSPAVSARPAVRATDSRTVPATLRRASAVRGRVGADIGSSRG